MRRQGKESRKYKVRNEKRGIVWTLLLSAGRSEQRPSYSLTAQPQQPQQGKQHLNVSPSCGGTGESSSRFANIIINLIYSYFLSVFKSSYIKITKIPHDVYPNCQPEFSCSRINFFFCCCCLGSPQFPSLPVLCMSSLTTSLNLLFGQLHLQHPPPARVQTISTL